MILDNIENTINDIGGNIRDSVIEFINTNYIIEKRWTGYRVIHSKLNAVDILDISAEPNADGKYVVNYINDDVKEEIYIEANGRIKHFTNGYFEWCVIDGLFRCDFCPLLETLEGAPRKVKDFYCQNCNNLKTLEGAPKKIGSNFLCDECDSLISLEGAPKEVGSNFSCSYCISLKTLDGAPKKIGGDFYHHNCMSLKL